MIFSGNTLCKQSWENCSSDQDFGPSACCAHTLQTEVPRPNCYIPLTTEHSLLANIWSIFNPFKLHKQGVWGMDTVKSFIFALQIFPCRVFNKTHINSKLVDKLKPLPCSQWKNYPISFSKDIMLYKSEVKLHDFLIS